MDESHHYRASAGIRAIVEQIIGPDAAGATASSQVKPIFRSEAERQIARTAYEVIRECKHLPSSSHLVKEEVSEFLVKRVEELPAPDQLELEDVTGKPDIAAAVVAKTTELLVSQTIDIPASL